MFFLLIKRCGNKLIKWNHVYGPFILTFYRKLKPIYCDGYHPDFCSLFYPIAPTRNKIFLLFSVGITKKYHCMSGIYLGSSNN